MFDYSQTDGGATLSHGSAASHTVWSHAPLRSISAHPLTPFSFSVWAEILRRGWFEYYSQLGFAPKYGANLCRQHHGFPYLNLSISAALDAEKAGVEPITLRIDGAPHALAEVKGRGLFGGFSTGRSQRKIQALSNEFLGKMDAITQKTRDWYLKIEELKWSQAEILQVMEEVERFGTDSLTAFFAARHNIDLLQNRLLWTMDENIALSERIKLATIPAHEVDGSIEQDIAQSIAALRTATDDEFDAGVSELASKYSYRCFSEGEISQPRWGEDQTSLVEAIRDDAFCAQDSSGPSTLSERRVALLDAGAAQQKEVGQWFDQLLALHQLESKARNAFAYILAGTRTWSKAAVHEAMTDNRILNAEDVYLFELEQIKEMMTGEWNVSSAAEIQAKAKNRQDEVKQWSQSHSPKVSLLIDDVEVCAVVPTIWPFWLGDSR